MKGVLPRAIVEEGNERREASYTIENIGHRLWKCDRGLWQGVDQAYSYEQEYPSIASQGVTPALLKTFLIRPNSLTKEDLYQADDDRDHHHIILVEDVRLVVSPGQLDTEDPPHKHTDNEAPPPSHWPRPKRLVSPPLLRRRK